MKILYIHQYFNTPNEPGGTRSYWFGRKLVEEGYTVVMITSARFEQKKLIERRTIDGIDVVYIKNSYDNNFGLLQRFVSFFRFMILSSYVSLIESNVNLIFATSTPLSVGFPALINFYLRKRDFIFEVRDLWPEVPIQMGAINNKTIKRILKNFEKLIYRKSKHIITLSPGMSKGVEDLFISKSKISMIPNMSKIDIFAPKEKNEDVFIKFNLSKSKRKVVYFGALGQANAIDFVNDMVIQSKEVDSLQWVIVGKGSQYDVLKRSISENELKNLVLIKAQPLITLSDIVNVCDLSLVTFSDFKILDTNSPNKLFDSLSAGKPILVNSNGWTKDMVKKYNCGIHLLTHNASESVNRIIQLSDSEISEMGKNSFELAEKKFDKSILVEHFSNIISKNI